LFNKKILKILSVSAISATLLTGCFSNERDTVISNAKKEYTNGNYEAARTYFEQANRMQTFNEKEADLNKSYHDVLNKLYVQYYVDGNSQRESKDFAKALESYEKAYAISGEDKDLKLFIKETKALAVEQKKLDDYMNLIKPIISNSNELLRGFYKNIDARLVGSLSDAEFKGYIKTIIPKSNDIMAKIDDSFTAVDGEIAPIHQSLQSLIQYQHATFSMVLEGAELKNLTERYNLIKQKQTQLIQDLQNYADNKGIAYRVETSTESVDEIKETK